MLVLAVCTTSLLAAQRASAQSLPPEPLEQRQPAAPQNRDGVALEGWVVLRYSVRADGTTDNIVVIDRQPPLIPYQRAVAAVEGWTFEPATVDGVPVDWHNNEALVAYRSEEARLSPLFFRAYDATQALIAEGNYAWARRNNQRTLMRATRLDVIGPVLIQGVIIHLRLGDLHGAHALLARATDPRIGVLPVAELVAALRYRNFLELQLGDRISALETLARRTALAPVPHDDPVLMRAAYLEQALIEGATIGVRARILDDVWRHTLSRQIFAITDVEGQIDGLRAECDRRLTELEYVPGSEWTLPEGWGNCAVAVEGRPDTEFRLYEFQ